MINKTNTLPLILRLTLTLCAILTAGLSGWADGASDLTAIEGYIGYTTEELVDGFSSLSKKTLLPYEGSYFYITNDNSLTLKTGSMDVPLLTGTKSSESYIEFKPTRYLVFKLKADSRFQIRIYGNGKSDKTRGIELYSCDINSDEKVSNANLLKSKVFADNSVVEYFTCDIITPSSDSYYTITGLDKDSPAYFYGIEIVPILTDTKLEYNGSDLSTITINSSNPIGTFPTLSASDFTASYSLDGWTTTNNISNFSDNLSFNNGEDNELWKGSKDLTWTQVYLKPSLFTDITWQSGDKIVFTATPITGSTASTADFILNNFWYSKEACGEDEDLLAKYDFNKRGVTLEDNGYTLTLDSDDKLTSIQSNGLYINASGVTITSVKYYPAGEDTDRFEVEGANISLNKTPFSDALTSITAQLKDRIVITSDAAYVMSADTSIPIKVTSTLPGILDLDFDAASLDSEYKYIVWHGIPGESIPTPVATFIGADTQVVTPKTFSYGTATMVAYLDDTSYIDDVDIAYTPVLTANSDGTTSVTLKDSSDNELDFDTAIYKNAIWSVTASATYDSTDTSSGETVTTTLGDSKTFYFVVLNPHFSFGEIGSQAKLLTGCETSKEYNNSVDDSTRPTWTGWEGETDYVKLFDKLGAYYMEASNGDWPLRYSYCLDDNMYKKNYHVKYKAYKDGNRDDDQKWAETDNESDGSSNDGIRFSPVGGSDIVDAENIYNSDEVDTDRLKTRYLEVRVYAKSSGVKDLAGEEILLSKSLYKIFYYLPPVISATGYVDTDMTTTGYQDSEGKDITTEKDYKAWKVTITSAKGGLETTFSDAKDNGVTYYTIDSNMPRKTTNLNTYEYDADYLKATRSTVYYAADFVTPDYWFYTPEEKEEVSKSLPVVSEKCLVKIIEAETYYANDDSAIDLTTDDKDKKRYNPYNATMLLNGMETLRLRIGNQNVVAYSDNDSKFRLAGVEWVKKNDTGFTEYIDEFEVPLIGNNYESDKTHKSVSGTIGTIDTDNTIIDGTVRSVVENPGDLSAWEMSSINADPITECNDRIGGTNTEEGGMFLTPISGAFFRLEPEYDGIVTLWIRQNGATETETRILVTSADAHSTLWMRMG